MSDTGARPTGPSGDHGTAERFILSGPAAVLGPLGPVLDRDPTVQSVGRRADRLIVEMTAARAAELAAALAPVLTIEPDDLVPPPTPALP